jgi:hypothetical protein
VTEGRLDGYNPNRAKDGKFAPGPRKARGARRRPPAFNAGPHQKRIARHKAAEAKHRKASLAVKAQMSAAKKAARAAPPAKRPAIRKRFERLAVRRAAIQAKAEKAKISRLAATKGMRDARREHAAKRKEGREKDKAARAQRAGSRDPIGKAQASHTAAVKAAQRARDAADDVDFVSARKHLKAAEGHRAQMEGHLERAKARGLSTDVVTKKGEPIADDAKLAVELAAGSIGFRERDQQGPYGRSAPERGALKSHEYRERADRYPAKLSADQKLAVSNYSDHTDRILNPMLRASKGKPPDADLYSGSHAPAEVHAERLVKRRERRAADRDYQTTVREEVRHLDAAIARHTFDRDVVAYRTMSDPGGKIAGGVKPGSVFRDHGYVSTTSDKNFLKDFATGDKASRVEVRVTIRKGARGAPMARLSTFDNEKEILLPRGSSFRVTKVVAASGDRPKEIHMETVDGE